MPDFPITAEEIEKARADVWEQLRVESDRGCILVSASILEDSLGAVMYQLLLKHDRCNHDKREGILNWMGPLGSFSSRIAMAYVFGIIPAWMYDCLEKIRGIRNDFAHGYSVADFSRPELAEVVNSMTSHEYDPDTTLKTLGFPTTGVVTGDQPAREYAIARLRFTLHVVQIAGRLYGRAEAIRLKPTSEFTVR